MANKKYLVKCNLDIYLTAYAENEDRAEVVGQQQLKQLTESISNDMPWLRLDSVFMMAKEVPEPFNKK